MSKKKKTHAMVKPRLHPRNRNRERYDFDALTATCPRLSAFVHPNKYNDPSIDFADPEAVRTLNNALLQHFYSVENWNIPEGYLCPPIPGRADYIHHLADLLRNNNYGKVPTGPSVRLLDVGVGASCIYPIIGHKEYDWSFVASDIDPDALASAEKIILNNPSLAGQIECRLQSNHKDFFYGVLNKDELIDASICNPPFHASAEAARSGNIRKQKNLTQKSASDPLLNFGGQSHELWCEGGEERFVGNMIRQSRKFGANCFWFTSMVSKQSNLKKFYRILNEVKAVKVETIPMGQGNKSSRMIAWTFLTSDQQKNWKNKRWAQVQ